MYPSIGSANTVTANALIPRPNTTPCVVQLFSNVDFADFNPKFFTYTPPADCPGPWAAVVINADWSIDAGRQFDRTAEIWIGGANVYFGTTAEPSKTVARSWHVESNLTDYSPLFTTTQAGRIDLGNLVNDTYTSVIHGSAYIQFYPLGNVQPPPTADIVLAHVSQFERRDGHSEYRFRSTRADLHPADQYRACVSGRLLAEPVER